MATSMTTDFSLSFPRSVSGPISAPVAVRSLRRRITPQAGRALEVLGHAIEYLTDEYVHRGEDLNAQNPEVAAVQLLMALNREVYFECPVAPTLAERLRSWLRIQFAQTAIGGRA
jgi:hypothetical protein